MEFYTLKAAQRYRPDYACVTHHQRSVYHLLMSYCAMQENSGRISGARNWPDDYWCIAADTNAAFMREPCGVWSWDGDDLLIKDYPLDQQQRLQKKRKKLKQANDNWRKQNGKTRSRSTSASTDSSSASVKKGNVRRGEVKKGKVRRGAAAPRNGSAEAAAALPRCFPQSAEEAIKLAPDLDAELVRKEWQDAAARDGRDFKMRLIRNWPRYIKNQKAFRDAAPAKASVPAAPPSASAQAIAPWRQLEAFQKRLAHVKEELKNLPRPNPTVFPDEYQQIEKRRAPLRAERDRLAQQIEALSSQTNPESE